MARSARDIAGYRLVAGLGEGGMARVYLALSKKAAGFSKLVVLKVLRSSAAEDPDLRRMFFDEARIAALLNHPNVVQTYEAGEDEGRLFLAMEYLEGKALSALAAGRGNREVPLDVHLRVLADMLEGLHYAHDVADVDGAPLDIIHRDVSPQNVLVTFAGQSKVVDFGIAKMAGSALTESGVLKGKLGYMAPEQIHARSTDRRADVFAAGVMLWEAIAQRRLVPRGEPEVASIARRMNGEDPSIRTVAPAGTPEELLAICDKAMSTRAEDRHATALELHDALDRYLRKTGGADAKRVAERMEASFGEERKKTRAFVEEQLRVADDSSPIIDIARHRAVILTAPHGATPPPILPSVPQSAPSSPTPGSAPDERTSASIGSPQVADVVAAPPRSTPRWALPALGGLAVAGLLLIGLSAALGSHGPSAKGGVSSAAETPTGATARLVIRTTPDSATLLLDDQPQVAPYEAKVARGATVRLAARAPGFVDYDRTLTVEADTNLDIALSRATPAATETAVAIPSAVSSAPSGRPDAKAKRKRAIDDGDPYRK